jgi:hypothetical protein
MLSRRAVDLFSPVSGAAPPLAPSQAAPPSPALGIFSGQPMPDIHLPASIWGFSDKAKSSSDDDEWYMRWRATLGD